MGRIHLTPPHLLLTTCSDSDSESRFKWQIGGCETKTMTLKILKHFLVLRVTTAMSSYVIRCQCLWLCCIIRRRSGLWSRVSRSEGIVYHLTSVTGCAGKHKQRGFGPRCRHSGQKGSVQWCISQQVNPQVEGQRQIIGPIQAIQAQSQKGQRQKSRTNSEGRSEGTRGNT